ncbi:MAG TPA: sulfatase [Phycisphaerae bacterium]|nr:sulfatase [Phycisphaerae bacterium]
MKRRDFLGAMGAGAAALVLPGCGTTARQGAGQAGRPPNVVIIFTDDQGYQDLGCFGSPLIRTPHLDRMAAEGVRFTDFYVAASVCSPSRAALMTGCYPQRVHMNVFTRLVKGEEKPGGGVLFQNSPRGLHPDEITIADLLKGRGYATACVGKWHLGHLPQFLPMRQGFDSYFGIPYSNDMNVARDGKSGPPLMRNGTVVEHPARQDTLTRRYTEEAVRFIRAQADRPFFLYLAHTMPHIPIHASSTFLGKSPRGLYGDVIEEIDWGVGEILKALDETGADEHTLVVFTSDNGPWLQFGARGGSALPLRDGKGTVFEGGMREPCVMRCPGRIPAGTICREVATTMDLLPTIARLAGASVPGDRVIDGRDIWPLMTGRPGATSPHEAFYYYQPAETAPKAVRCGPWKLFRPGPRYETHKTDDGKFVHRRFDAPVELYHLGTDVGETRNVAGENPDVVRRLTGMIEAFDKDLTAHSRPAGPAGDLASSPASA